MGSASAKKTVRGLLRRIQRDPADRRLRARWFQDILAVAKWKKIPLAELFRRAGKSRQIYYKFRVLGDVPRRSTLWRLWEALGLSEEDRARLLSRKILLSSETLKLLETWPVVEKLLIEGFQGRVRGAGRKVVAMRRARGWNQTELAKAAGVSKGLLYKIETARWRGDFSTYVGYLERIAQALGVGVEDLF